MKIHEANGAQGASWEPYLVASVQVVPDASQLPSDAQHNAWHSLSLAQSLATMH